jgi:hypothetical protein
LRWAVPDAAVSRTYLTQIINTHAADDALFGAGDGDSDGLDASPHRHRREMPNLRQPAPGHDGWLAQPGPALLDVKVLAMQLVTPPLVSREAVVGMAVYSARAILHCRGHEVWETVEENISQGK